jgi:hypothetical protein
MFRSDSTFSHLDRTPFESIERSDRSRNGYGSRDLCQFGRISGQSRKASAMTNAHRISRRIESVHHTDAQGFIRILARNSAPLDKAPTNQKAHPRPSTRYFSLESVLQADYRTESIIRTTREHSSPGSPELELECASENRRNTWTQKSFKPDYRTDFIIGTERVMVPPGIPELQLGVASSIRRKHLEIQTFGRNPQTD